MKNRIKNFAFLDKIQAMQLKISKCFDDNKNIIYCNNIFVQLPTIQFKIVELNIVSGLKREDTITMTSIVKEQIEHPILQIESTRRLDKKELGKIIKLFQKTTHFPKLIYTENEATAQAKEFENDMEFLEDIVKEERKIKINNLLINKTDE